MKRYCLALDLVDDAGLIAEYEQWHRPGGIWPEIKNSILQSGILQMEIYRTGNRLFMIMETTDEFDPAQKAASDAANPKVDAWEKLMGKFQQPLPWAEPGQKWVAMQKIFDLQAEKQADR